MTRQWTRTEDALIAKLYPTMGNEGTRRELAKAGFDRTAGAVKARASSIGVRKAVRKPNEDQWKPEEMAIIAKYYPEHGAEETSEALAKAGYDRTASAVRMRANILGVKNESKRKRVGETKMYNFCLDTVLDSELIDRLGEKRNRSAYIRDLITRDIRE